jgi:hypothetical protein
MMDAVSYLTNLSRLCDYFTSREMCGDSCPVFDYCNSGNDITEEDAKESVAAVKRWSVENPLVTNGDVVKEMLPDGSIVNDQYNPMAEHIFIEVPKDWWKAEYKGVE